jgi:hypothetical protein
MLFGTSLAQGLQQCCPGGKKEGGWREEGGRVVLLSRIVIPALCFVRTDTVAMQDSSGG